MKDKVASQGTIDARRAGSPACLAVRVSRKY